MDNIFLILAAGFFIIGAAFTAIGAGIHHAFKKKAYACSVPTDAVITEYKQEWSLTAGGEGNLLWHPTFAYTAGGKTYKVHSVIGSRKKKFEEGQAMTLFYDPSDPINYYVPEENPLYITKLFIFIGIVFLIFGFICLMVGISVC